MNIKKIENSFESNKKISLSPPAVELFSDPSRAAEAWPEQIANNKEFLNFQFICNISRIVLYTRQNF